jgi:hypothetical protein
VTGSKREDVTGHWKKQHNEEPYDSHSSPDNVGDIKLKRMRRTEPETRTGKERGYRVLVRIPGEKKLLGIPRRRWEYSIKMDIQEIISEAWSG